MQGLRIFEGSEYGLASNNLAFVEYTTSEDWFYQTPYHHELFDMEKDKFQLENLYSKTSAETLQKLQARLESQWKCKGAAECQDLVLKTDDDVIGLQRPMSVAWYDATRGMVEQYPVKAIPWSNLTHIVYNGGYQPASNGSLAVGQDCDCTLAGCTLSWSCDKDLADCTETLHAVRDAATANGVKVLIGGLDLFEGNTSLAYAFLNSSDCPSISGSNVPCIETYATSIAAYVTEHELDGVEFDFEDFGDWCAKQNTDPAWRCMYAVLCC